MSNDLERRDFKANARFLLPYLRPYSFKLGLGILFVVASVYLAASPVRIVEGFVDALRAGEMTRARIAANVAKFMGLSISAAVLLFFQRRIITEASRDMEYHIRKDFLDYLHRQTAAFFLRSKTGDIMSRATNDLGNVREMIGAGILHLLRTAINLVIIVAMMLAVNVKYSVIALVPVAALPLISLRLLRRMGARYTQIQEHLGEINSIVQETFAGVAVVKAYGREEVRYRKFEAANDAYFKVNLSLAKILGLIWPLFSFVAALSPLFLLYFGGKAVMRGDMTLGNLVALNMFVGALTWPLIGLGWVANMIERGMASAGRLRQFLSQPVVREKAGDRHFAPGDLVIRNLTFRHPGAGRPSLIGVSLTVKRGETAAIVGTVGSGKTTLVNLFPRICDPPPGTLFLGESDLLDYSLQDLREHLAVVPQDIFLFSDTIRNNIEFGRPSGEEALSRALHQSRIDKDLPQIPGGLDQMLGERGINLSGGQRQRVAIARALLRDPDILILDDCLSAVDAHTEAEILSEFGRVFRGRTVILVSHRVSAIRFAHRIFVMDEGRIVEEGDHASLSARGGLYARLLERQKVEEELA